MQKFAKQLAKCICQCKIWTNFVVISFAVAWQLCSEGVLSGGLFTRSRLNYFVQKIRRNVQIKTAESHKNKTGNQRPTDDSDQSPQLRFERHPRVHKLLWGKEKHCIKCHKLLSVILGFTDPHFLLCCLVSV